MRVLIFIITLKLLLLSTGGRASEAVVNDLTPFYLVYDKEVASFVPLVSANSKYSLLVQRINFDENKRYNLQFSSPEKGYLFVNGQISKCFFKDSVYSFSLSSFEPFVRNGELLFTFSFGEKKVKPFPIALAVINKNKTEFNHVNYALLARGKQLNNDVLLLSVLFILVVVAIMKGQDRGKLVSYFSPYGLLRGKKIDDYIINGVSDLQNLPFVYMVSLFWAVFMVYNNYSVIDLGVEEKLNNFDLVLKYLLWNSVAIVVFFWIKYLFLKALATLVSLKGIVNYYYFEIIRYYAISAFVLMVLSVFYEKIGLNDNVIVYTSVLLLLFWMIRLSTIFFKRVGLHKVFIISYLCASEILPLFILVKGITSF